MRALTAGEEVVEEELVIRDAAGRPVHYAVSAIPVRDAAGKVTTVVSLFRDVTAGARGGATERRFPLARSRTNCAPP